MIARLVLVALIAAGSAANAHVGPHPEAGVEFEQRLGASVPTDARFVDERGAGITLGEAIAGKPSVLVLGYTRCRDLCATTVPGVAEALDHARLRPALDYRAVFVSIDSRENAAALSEGMARVPEADRGGWHFMGGNEDGAKGLAQAVGFRYRYEPDRDAFAHPAGFVVLTPRGGVSRYFFGVRFDATDVRRAIEEAGRGSTGSLTDRLLLLCYHFDPLTGRYSAAILDGLRVLGVASMLAAAMLFLRGRKRRAAA
jgi:Uncharacterized protein SCO1/SenC/PrrC, involved in biogenesis of respiratory and photosynthetic systems